MDRLRAGKPVSKPSLERFRIAPSRGTVAGERLIEEPMELPRINYGRCNERPYRYAWGVGRRQRLDRPDRQGRRRRSPCGRLGRGGLLPGRARVRGRSGREGRGRGRAARPSSSTARGATRSCWFWTPARSTSWREPRCRITSRSGSTASSPEPDSPLRLPEGQLAARGGGDDASPAGRALAGLEEHRGAQAPGVLGRLRDLGNLDVGQPERTRRLALDDPAAELAPDPEREVGAGPDPNLLMSPAACLCVEVAGAPEITGVELQVDYSVGGLRGSCPDRRTAARARN